MTSQLNVDTIVDKAGTSGPSLPNTTTIKIGNTSTYVSEGGGATQNTVQGLAKFWIKHNDAASVSDSFNQASTTDNGTGDYSHSFTNNMGGAGTYAMSGLALAINDKATFINGNSSNVDFTTSSFRYQTGYVANTSGAQTNHDCNATSPVVNGDLA
jgi:hypothetical protein